MGFTYRLRVDEFRRAQRKAGILTDQALADQMGISRTSLWRVIRDRHEPSKTFIAAAMGLFTGLEIRDLFEHVYVGDGEDENGDDTQPPLTDQEAS